MLTVRIEKDHPLYLRIWFVAGPICSIQPIRESCLNCFAFAAIFIVNNHFSPGFACAWSRLVGRAVIDDENVIKPLAGSTRDVADVFFVLVRRNNRGGLRS